MKNLFTTLLLTIISLTAAAKTVIEPSATYLYASRDSCELYMDIYEPADGAPTSIDGVQKPAILFVFGGGFKEGERDGELQKLWFKQMTDNGFRIIAIDYRLGLKGAENPGLNMKFAKKLDSAIGIAVEDLFSATRFICDNAEELNIDPADLVICGSSAGAITVLQAEWKICNGDDSAKVLPAGFNYKGVMSFAGAIFSTEGAVSFKKEPCPLLMMHGTDDRMVVYKQMKLLKLRFAGTDALTSICASKGYSYNTYRFDGNGHEISIALMRCFEEEMRFISENVMKGQKRNLDCTVSDPSIEIPSWARKGYKSLYK